MLKEILTYGSPLKFLSALGKSTFEALFRGKSGERWKIFRETFKAEYTGVQAKEKETTKETEAAVDMTLEENIKKLDEAIGLKNVTPDEKARHDEVKVFAIKGFANVHSTKRGKALSGLQKWAKSSNKEATDVLDFDEAGAMAAVGLSTLSDLKKKYPKKDDFKKALDDFSKISDKSKFPLSKILSMSALAIFKVDTGGSAWNPANWGKKQEALDFVGKFGLDRSEAEKLADLKNDPMEDKDGVVEVFEENLFPNSGDADDIVDEIHELIIKKPDPIDTESLADLLFLIDDQDLDNLITILGGNEVANT